MKLSLLLLFFVLLAAVPAHAVKSKCSPHLSRDAQSALDELKNWNDMYEWFTHYAPCDFEQLRKLSASRIGWLLTYDWDHFSHFGALVIFDKKFQPFVLSHIDATLPPNILQRIADNTVSFCPSRSADACLMVGNAAHTALRHSE